MLTMSIKTYCVDVVVDIKPTLKVLNFVGT